MLRTVIVDDETLARQRIIDLLTGDPEIEVVGQAAYGEDAVALLARETPELVFMDIRLPDMDGFEILAAADVHPDPFVVFVTAYDHHAVRAFDRRAVDYLVKPFERERFFMALGRAKREWRNSLLATAPPESPGPEGRIALKLSDRVIRLRPEEIEYLSADGDTALCHLSNGSTLDVRESLAAVEKRLPPGIFLRVHRSHIVNTAKVREIHPWFHGDFVLRLEHGGQVVTGRTFRERIRALTR